MVRAVAQIMRTLPTYVQPYGQGASSLARTLLFVTIHLKCVENWLVQLQVFLTLSNLNPNSIPIKEVGLILIRRAEESCIDFASRSSFLCRATVHAKRGKPGY